MGNMTKHAGLEQEAARLILGWVEGRGSFTLEEAREILHELTYTPNEILERVLRETAAGDHLLLNKEHRKDAA